MITMKDKDIFYGMTVSFGVYDLDTKEFVKDSLNVGSVGRDEVYLKNEARFLFALEQLGKQIYEKFKSNDEVR